MNGAALPDRTLVLVIGGGIIGCSVAYHLTRRGITDQTVIEQGTLTCGTNWHAAGLVTQLKATHSLTRLATYSARPNHSTASCRGWRRAGVARQR